jgi:hypothetical protein
MTIFAVIYHFLETLGPTCSTKLLEWVVGAHFDRIQSLSPIKINIIKKIIIKTTPLAVSKFWLSPSISPNLELFFAHWFISCTFL